MTDDALSKLSRLTIDGLMLPTLRRRAGLAGEQARHKFQFRSGELVEPLGSRNILFEYTIPFRQNIAKGPYRDLFVKGLPRFVAIVRKAMSQPVSLFDPVQGYFEVTCVSFSEATDNNKRDGTDVEVQFLHSPNGFDDDPGNPLASLDAASAEAGALDRETGVILRSRQVAPGEPLIDPLSALSGLLSQLETRANQAQAAVADFASRINEVEDSIAALEDPGLQPTVRSLRNLRAGAEVMKDRITNPVGIARRYTTAAAMTVGELASFLGVDPNVLMSSNPALAESAPMVSVGTSVSYEGK